MENKNRMSDDIEYYNDRLIVIKELFMNHDKSLKVKKNLDTIKLLVDEYQTFKNYDPILAGTIKTFILE